MLNRSISIIVPVYNVETYLSKCIESILAQTFTNFELLLIDDGSTDKSSKICDEYAAQDERIRVFHKTNGGVASARQFGIERAKGSFSIQIDPDDWIEDRMLEDLYHCAVENESDYVICDFFEDSIGVSKLIKQKPQTNDAKSVIIGLLTDLHGSCCNKLVSRKFYKNSFFKDGINLTEDLLYNLRILSNNPKVTYLPSAYYHYNIYINSNSLSKTYTAARFRQINSSFYEALKILNKEKLSELIRKKYVNYLCYFGIKSKDLSASEYRRALIKYSWYIITSSETLKVKAGFLLAILGLKKFLISQ